MVVIQGRKVVGDRGPETCGVQDHTENCDDTGGLNLERYSESRSTGVPVCMFCCPVCGPQATSRGPFTSEATPDSPLICSKWTWLTLVTWGPLLGCC